MLTSQVQESLRSRCRRIAKYSKGQTAVILTLVAVTLTGAMALGTDVAVLYYNWVSLQKAADSAALAGASYLPNNTDTAKTTAIAYAKNNGIAASEISTPTFSNSNTRITINLQRTVPYAFATLLGLANGQVSVTSTATLPGGPSTIGGPILVGTGGSGGGSGSGSGGSGSGGSGSSGTPVSPTCGTSTGAYDILPIAVDNQTASAWSQGSSYTLNRTGTGSNGPWVDAPGNWGTVNLCGSNGNGGNGVRTAIADGFFGPISIGQTLTTLPGAKVGPLGQGFSDRMTGTDNPTTFTPSDPRAVLVPLVSGFSTCTGACSVTVTGFMAFYVDSYSGGAITGHFIKMAAIDAAGNPTVTTDAGVAGDPILIK